MRTTIPAAILGMVLGAASIGHADVLASNTAGTSFGGLDAYLGQSFTTAAGPAATDVTFNFFSDAPATTPFAAGTGFLLSQEYTGAPGDLGTSTPGFLGEAAASGGLYSFGTAVTLAGGTQYFFYENALVPTGTITGGDTYAGGQGYIAQPGSDFIGIGESHNFLVSGAPVPEPSSLALCGLGVVGAAGYARRRRAARASVARIAP